MVYSLISVLMRRKISKLPGQIFRLSDFIVYSQNVNPICHFRTWSPLQAGESQKSGSLGCGGGGDSGADKLNAFVCNAMKGKINPKALPDIYSAMMKEVQLKKYREAPQPILSISVAGALPFVGVPLVMLASGSALQSLVFADLALGATILSFLGGSNWLDAISKNEVTLDRLVWSLAPQLMGWSSLLLPTSFGLLMCATGFCGAAAHDVLLTSYPQWYKSLRVNMTGVVVASLSRRKSWSSRSRSRSSRSRSRSRNDRSKSSRSLSKKRSPSRSNSSKSHSRSRSTSKNRTKAQDKSPTSKSSSSSSSSSSRTPSPKQEDAPKPIVPRYYGRNRKDSSSSLNLDSSDSDSKTNSEQPSSSNSNRAGYRRVGLDISNSSIRSAGNARTTSKQPQKEKPQERLKKKMQAMLNRQFRADKKAEKERLEKAEQERQDREAELRDIAIKIRRRERYLRHMGEDEEADGEQQSMRRRERYLRRLEEDSRHGERREGDCVSISSGSLKSCESSPDFRQRKSRSPRRGSRRSRSPSPRGSRPGKRTLVDY